MSNDSAPTALLTAIVTADPVFGPWHIPSRGQNMINNYYAQGENITVDTVIPEPLFSHTLSTTQWARKNRGIGRIILCSIHQLPWREADNIIEEFIHGLKEVEFVFSLEGIRGKGEAFLQQQINEARAFNQIDIIDYNQVDSYDSLHKIMMSQKVSQEVSQELE